jgi:hypothetical protein
MLKLIESEVSFDIALLYCCFFWACIFHPVLRPKWPRGAAILAGLAIALAISFIANASGISVTLGTLVFGSSVIAWFALTPAYILLPNARHVTRRDVGVGGVLWWILYALCFAGGLGTLIGHQLTRLQGESVLCGRVLDISGLCSGFVIIVLAVKYFMNRKHMARRRNGVKS